MENKFQMIMTAIAKLWLKKFMMNVISLALF
jgi:hypothetical protein